MTTGNELALSLGNDFPIRSTVQSEHGETVTGLTLQGYFALTEGGDAITSPVTTVSLTEDTSTPATARVYYGTLDQVVVDQLVDLGKPALWLAIEGPGDTLVWKRIPVIRHRRLP